MEDERRLIHVEGIELEISGTHENEEKLSASSQKNGSSDSGDTLNEFGSSWNQFPVDEGVTLAWRDVSVTANSNGLKRIIHNVSGAVKTGSLVALMGASGAGKSTLMSALAYRHSGNLLVEGDILVNGKKIGDEMKYLTGYMHQEDLFIGALTVLEHMTIMARIKLDRRLSSYERESKVYDILYQLNLVNCLNTRIGLNGEDKILSGGEKKRLAFATELLTDPPLLFCDEPTTGLDSYSAQKLVRMMNIMASQGKTIVCTIHQPSSELFAMFSQILLVADGRIAFMGSTQNALEFFKRMGYRSPTNYNPADFFIRTLALQPGSEETSKQTIKKICDNFAVSEAAKEMEVVINYEFHLGRSSSYSSFPVRRDYKRVFWWTSFYILAYRGLLECVRDPRIQGLRMLQKIAIAVMVGFCYLGTNALTQTGIQSVQGAVFILTAENVFAPMYTVLNLFPQEFPLFHREYQNGLYPVGVYYLAKMVAILPGIILEPVVFTIITYFMSGLRMSSYVIIVTILIATLTMNVSIACGCFFSTLFGSVPTAMAYLVPFDVILMVTQGVFVKLSSLPMEVSWVQYLSWLMYSTETMTILQWDGINNITCEIPDPKIPCISNGEEVLQKYSFEKSNFLPDIYYMILIYLAFHILGFFCLWRRARKK